MHHNFFRLLLGIVLVTIIILFFQFTMVSLLHFKMERNWKNSVFSEFIEELKNKIQEEGELKLDSIFSPVFLDLAISSCSERVLGLIVSRNNQVKLFERKIEKPLYLPPPKDRKKEIKRVPIKDFGEIKEVEYDSSVSQSISYKDSKALLSINENSKGIISVESTKLENSKQNQIKVPEFVKKEEIAGSVIIYFNGEELGVVNVLVFNVNKYSPTKYVLSETLKAFFITFPLCVLISFFAAWIISKKNERLINQYKNAIAKLSLGEFDIKLKKTKVREFEEISESLKSLAKDLERHSESRKEWIRNISHDLNTPLTSMNLLIHGASENVFPLDRELLNALMKENDILVKRISSVAYYSYLLSPDCKVQKEEVNILELIDEVEQREKVALKLLIKEDFNLYVDRVMVERALSEVIRNAEEYKKGNDEIIVECKEGVNSYIISVSNPGLIPYPRPLFFEPWARGDWARTSGGSGMGLPITYQIMKLMDSRIEIKEEDGRVVCTLIFNKQT